MKFTLRAAVAASARLISISAGGTASAQKRGGVLRMYTPDSPASMSIHEEATVFAQGPMMGVFNNLIMFDQHVPQNSPSVCLFSTRVRPARRPDLPSARS